jgi:catechol 2,3-dioxygenase-like lactoylglutathione lyase family enzyme
VIEPRLSFLTLGVSDLGRALAFYEGVLGLRRRPSSSGIAMFPLGPTILALYPREALAADAGLQAGPPPAGFPGFALAHNLPSKAEVERVYAAVLAGGGRAVQPPREKPWGGFSGYFADPDGFLWELCFNPFLPLEPGHAEPRP